MAGFPHFLEINLMRALFEQKKSRRNNIWETKNKHITHQSIHSLEFFTPPKNWQPKPMMGKGRPFRLSVWVICPFFQGEFRWFIFSQSWDRSPPRVGIVYTPGGCFIFFLVFFVKKKWSNFKKPPAIHWSKRFILNVSKNYGYPQIIHF